MLINKVFLVAILCIFHTQAAQVAMNVGISNSTRELLEQAILDTIQAAKESTVEVMALKNLFQTNVNDALVPVDKQLKKLRCDGKKADKQSPEVADCYKQLRLAIKAINKDGIQKCTETVETEAADAKLYALINFQGILRSSLSNCADKGLLADTCVNNIIGSVRSKSFVLQDEISIILRHINPEQRDECVDEAVKSLQTQSDKIAADWDACVKKVAFR